MRNHLLLSLFCSVLLHCFCIAQTASSASNIAPTETGGTTSQLQATATNTITPTGTNTNTASSSSDTVSSPVTSTGGSSGSGTTTSVASYGSSPPDVLLKVPELHVGRIELDVDNMSAEINLAAQIANLVEINAGVQIGITKVNITIADVDANLDLVIRLGNLADIVNRTLESLNLNPLLINILNETTSLVD
ncbi:hypothetical protein F4804DRAFT_132199 [Jackrogersella minutella]|nr:hypothetical protein F4804DRAFT_132199 [Jackrogersella minutella]